MNIPENRFKKALSANKHQKGFWLTLASPYSAEALAGAGFDWFLIDMEHSPNEMDSVLSQLQTLAAYPVSSIVRPVWNDPLLIKRLLDVGVQTLLLPYVQNAEEAQNAVNAMRYPPRGIRGVSTVTRATHFGRVKNYMTTCENELCLLVQVETQSGLDNIEEIARVEGVDGIFIGPADLSASLGFPGQQSHPEVIKAIENAIKRIRACHKGAGILTTDKELAKQFIECGTTFTAIGVDAALLSRAAEALAKEFV
jgi:4-hydroxy-2-oxoheptanedioate aldolase